MACRYCNSEEWKSASLVYREGISDIRSNTRAHGLGVGTSGIGLGVGGAKTRGYQQSMLSKAASPPRRGFALALFLAGIAILFTLGAASGSNFPLFDLIIVILCTLGIFYSYQREKRRYDAATAVYAATRVCQRCGQFYRDPLSLENEVERRHNQSSGTAGVFAFLALVGISAVVVLVWLAHKPEAELGKQASVQPSPTTDIPSPVGQLAPDNFSRYRLYKTKIEEAAYLRSLFTDYLSGETRQTDEGDRPGEFALLDKWDRSYYPSKFYVLLIERAPIGGQPDQHLISGQARQDFCRLGLQTSRRGIRAPRI